MLLLCRCHRDHLFVIRDGLLVRPYVRNRAPLRSVSVRLVEDQWRTPGATGARTQSRRGKQPKLPLTDLAAEGEGFAARPVRRSYVTLL